MLGHLPRRLAPLPLLSSALLALGGLAFLSTRAAAQEGGIVSSQVVVSGQDATLLLEPRGRDPLELTLRSGALLVNGQEAGRFTAGGGLEASWRELLGHAISLEPSELRGLLLAWRPPGDLPEDASLAAAVLRSRLDEALTGAAAGSAPGSATTLSLGSDSAGRAALEALIRSGRRLSQLAAATADLGDGDLRVHGGETVRVGENESVTAHLIVLDGDLHLDGTVDGDLVFLGGSVRLGPESRITGALRWADAEILGNRDAVAGGIQEVTPVSVSTSPAPPPPPPPPSGVAGDHTDLREQIRQGVLEATREATAAGRQRSSRSGGSAFANLGQGIGGLFQTLVTFGIMLAAGLALLYFFPRQLEVVSRTARTTTGRSALVGLAGMVLALPLWIVGTVLLAVSIIGIPALLVWIPGLPLAIALALGFGYLAVARNLGRWISGRDMRTIGGLDATRPAVHVGAGLVVLLAAFALANVFKMGGAWFGIFQGVLYFFGFAFTAFAFCVGLGAVILSRAGQNPAFAGPGWGPTGEEVPEDGEPDLV